MLTQPPPVQANPLNRVQRGLLASHLAAPDKGHQNAAMLIRIRGAVDSARLAQAFEAVVLASQELRVRLDSDSHKPIPSPDIPAATQVVADTPRQPRPGPSRRPNAPST